jgi:hypothetical protein
MTLVVDGTGVDRRFVLKLAVIIPALKTAFHPDVDEFRSPGRKIISQEIDPGEKSRPSKIHPHSGSIMELFPLLQG